LNTVYVIWQILSYVLIQSRNVHRGFHQDQTNVCVRLIDNLKQLATTGIDSTDINRTPETNIEYYRIKEKSMK
jgi:hypothetical protein